MLVSSLPRRAAAVGLTALALSLTGSPALAQDALLPQLGTVTPVLEPVKEAAAPVLDPVVQAVAPSPEPEPTREPEPDPLPVPVPEPLRPVTDPVVAEVQAVAEAAPSTPVTGNGSTPRPVAAPAGAGPAAQPATVSTVTTPATLAAQGATRVGPAPLAARTGGAPGLPAGPRLAAGTGVASVPALGAPMVAPAPAFTLPGTTLVPAPQTAVAAPRPSGPASVPEGLPALVLAVAIVALVSAGAGHAAELRVRRAAAASS